MRLDACSVMTRTAVARCRPLASRSSFSCFTYRHSVFSRKMTMSIALRLAVAPPTTGRTLAYRSSSLRILTIGELYPSTLCDGELHVPSA